MTTGDPAGPRSARVETLRRMADRNPDDPRPHFGLAAEYERAEDWPRVVEHLETYLRLADDQGNAWGRLGKALRALGRGEEARDAYRRGIEAAQRHGHPTMAAEFEHELSEGV